MAVVEGSYCLHPSVRLNYDFKIFLTVDCETQLARIKVRNPDLYDRSRRRVYPQRGAVLRGVPHPGGMPDGDGRLSTSRRREKNHEERARGPPGSPSTSADAGRGGAVLRRCSRPARTSATRLTRCRNPASRWACPRHYAYAWLPPLPVKGRPEPTIVLTLRLGAGSIRRASSRSWSPAPAASPSPDPFDPAQWTRSFWAG